jgi:predicted metal-dependent hydrolase
MKVHFIENSGYKIKCEFIKRKNSRNIRMHLDNNGIVKVSLPYYTPYIAAKEFVNNNLNWIAKKFDLFKLQINTYYYLGENISLIKKYDANIKIFNYILHDNVLIVQARNFKDFSDEKIFNLWLKEKAIDYIPPKVKEFSEIHNFEYNSVRIKNLTSRWGSCTNKRNLTFNLKLMYFDTDVIDYVIIHELCHLKEMNHSSKFWKLVEEIMPDYKNHKIKLTQAIHT